MSKRKSVKYVPENCVFCFTNDLQPLLGPLLEKGGMLMHANCIFSASGISQGTDNSPDECIEGFKLESIRSEIKRGRRLSCTFCRKWGACVGCAVSTCPTKYHLPCLIKARGLTLFKDPFPSYCWRHSPKQNLLQWLNSAEEAPSCCVCLFSILPDDENTLQRCKSGRKAAGQCSVINQLVETPRRNNIKPPRRSCVSVSTPKRIRVSYGMSSIKQRLSLSNTSSTWELPDSSPEPDVLRHSPPLASSGEPSLVLPNSLRYLPKWMGDYLSTRCDADPLYAYEVWLHNTVHGLCCPKSWMHRTCIAGFAVSAALHFIKCPYCADKKTFIQAIIDAGIWVPDRDAAWELEPGAFAELEPVAESSSLGTRDSRGPGNSLVASGSLSNERTLSSDLGKEPTIPPSQEDHLAYTEVGRPQLRRSRRITSLKSAAACVRHAVADDSDQREVDLHNAPTATVAIDRGDKPSQVLSLVWSNDRFNSRRRPFVRSRARPGSRRYTQTSGHNNQHKSPTDEESAFQSRGRTANSATPTNPTIRSPTESRMRQATLGDFLHRYRSPTSN